MNDHPALILLVATIGVYMMHLWREDYRSFLAGRPNPQALPGATPCSLKACTIACAGALVILTAETLGEIQLGVSDQQSKMTALFAVYTLLAAFIEELIFRGFVVIDDKGKALRWIGIIAASGLFAALHPFLWRWEDGSFSWTADLKGWFSTTVVFISSLWFYTVRFAGFNPHRSLLPSISAHAIKNLGVIGIKAVQGYIVGWW